MLRSVRLLAVVLVSVCLGTPAASTQRQEPQLWEDLHYEPLHIFVKGEVESSNYSLADYAAARVKSDDIMSELAKAQSEWAGEFGRGIDLSFVRLRWAPEAGFVRVQVYTCRPSVEALNYGTAVESSHFVDLVPVIGLDPSWKAGSVQRLVKVKWGEERYLIPEQKVGSFCDYVAGLGEYNGDERFKEESEFFRKLDDHPDPANDLPILPPGYEHLVKRSIDVSIVSVGRPYVRKSDSLWNDLVTPVTINAGSNQGVRDGMVFLLFESDRAEVITITKIRPRTSVGEVVRLTHKPGVKLHAGDDGSDPVYDPLRAGWRASTSVHKVLARHR